MLYTKPGHTNSRPVSVFSDFLVDGTKLGGIRRVWPCGGFQLT